MKTLNVCSFICAFLFFTSFSVYCQTIKPIAEIELGNNVTSFKSHPTTGAQIILTSKEILGFNPYTQQISWRVQRGVLNAVADTDPNSSSDDFLAYPSTPYLFASKNIINSMSGGVVISNGKDNFN